MRLEADETKNSEARTIYLDQELLNRNCKGLDRVGHQEASGVSVRRVGVMKMLGMSCGAREGTRTPTDRSTGS